ncbi:unnamed protein product, partial [Meganyctiphanes norvegica]
SLVKLSSDNTSSSSSTFFSSLSSTQPNMKFSMSVTLLLLGLVLYTEAQIFRPRQRNRKPNGCPNRGGINLPPQWQIDLALNNRKTLSDAIECIRSDHPVCPGLPYGSKLKQVAPDLILFGRCHPCICSPKEQQDALRLIRKISTEHPQKFSRLYSELARKQHRK